ncbi:MAG: phage terminase large subunit [Rhizobiaceae bacterium]
MKLTRSQFDFVTSTDPVTGFVGGYGSGKTEALMTRAVNLTHSNKITAIYFPTFDLCKNVGMARMTEKLSSLGMRYGKDFVANKSDYEIHWHGYGKFIFRSMSNPDRIIAFESDSAICDEIDLLKFEHAQLAFERILGRNRRSSDATIGITTTPEGLNWAYHHFKTPKPGWRLIKASTYENIHIPREYISNIRQNYTSKLAAAYLDGDFVNLNDALFQRDWEQTSNAPLGSRMVVSMGVDLAISKKTSADFSALVILGRDIDTGQIFVIHSERAKMSFAETLARIQALYGETPCHVISVEKVAYQAAMVDELLRQTTLPVQGVTPDTDKVSRAVPFAARMEQGLVTFHGTPTTHQTLIDEMVSFPGGKNDDMIDACSLAFRGLDDVAIQNPNKNEGLYN